METWNREELYEEIWNEPMVKVAKKYGISSVALGKVCRKLQIPLPGRGYWVKKQFGKTIVRPPLLPGKDLPVVQRLKFPEAKRDSTNSGVTPPPEPTDPEYLSILQVESRTIVASPESKVSKLVAAARKHLGHARVDERGILQQPFDQPCLELRVSKGALERALMLANAIIEALEAENFPVSVEKGRHGTGVQIFGHRVPFALVEKVREKSRRQVTEHSWTRTIIEYEPTEDFEFRVGDFAYGRKLRDKTKRRLEMILPACIGLLMREGRARLISAKVAAQNAIEREKKQKERLEIAQQIAEEEKRVRDLENWVSNWTRAQQIRDFVVALEKLWVEEGHDLSPTAHKGQRIRWMRDQADRVDPMIPSPPSILDRKGEIRSW